MREYGLQAAARSACAWTVMMFLLLGLIVCAAGVTAYKSAKQSAQENASVRAASMYVTEKLRECDGTVAVENEQGRDILRLGESDGFCTALYGYEGYLCEAQTLCGDVLPLYSGQRVTQAQDIAVRYDKDGLIHFTLSTRGGRCAQFAVRAYAED